MKTRKGLKISDDRQAELIKEMGSKGLVQLGVTACQASGRVLSAKQIAKKMNFAIMHGGYGGQSDSSDEKYGVSPIRMSFSTLKGAGLPLPASKKPGDYERYRADLVHQELVREMKADMPSTVYLEALERELKLWEQRAKDAGHDAMEAFRRMMGLD